MRYVLPIAFVVLLGCERREESKPPTRPTMVDPVCGMDVQKDGAKFKSSRGGQEFFFCNSGCKEKFEKTPEPYLKGYCGCSETMEKCKCDHCGALAATRAPASACPCGEKSKHDHDH